MPDFAVNLGYRDRKISETYIVIYKPIFLAENTWN